MGSLPEPAKNNGLPLLFVAKMVRPLLPLFVMVEGPLDPLFVSVTVPILTAPVLGAIVIEDAIANVELRGQRRGAIENRATSPIVRGDLAERITRGESHPIELHNSGQFRIDQDDML